MNEFNYYRDRYREDPSVRVITVEHRGFDIDLLLYCKDPGGSCYGYFASLGQTTFYQLDIIGEGYGLEQLHNEVKALINRYLDEGVAR